jgi:hypothetical protein
VNNFYAAFGKAENIVQFTANLAQYSKIIQDGLDGKNTICYYKGNSKCNALAMPAN